MVDVASDELEVAAGLELLDSSDNLIMDITDDLVLTGSEVSRDNRARIHGTCRLVLSRQVNWHNQRLRPYVILTDLDDSSLRYDLGIYLPETPTRTAGESPQTYQVEGYDKLVILATPHGSTFEATAGDGYVATVEALLSGEAFTIDQTAASKTLPSTKVWPIDETTTTLSIINELLTSINYRGLYADRAGRFTSDVWESPTTRSPI